MPQIGHGHPVDSFCLKLLASSLSCAISALSLSIYASFSTMSFLSRQMSHERANRPCSQTSGGFCFMVILSATRILPACHLLVLVVQSQHRVIFTTIRLMRIADSTGEPRRVSRDEHAVRRHNMSLFNDMPMLDILIAHRTVKLHKLLSTLGVISNASTSLPAQRG